MRWRVVYTDSESLTGVAPVCPVYEQPQTLHGEHDVLDCCPRPHLETYGERDAEMLVVAMNAVAGGEGLELCP